MKDKNKICPLCNQECDLKKPAEIVLFKEKLWHEGCYRKYWNNVSKVEEPIWNTFQELWSIGDRKLKPKEPEEQQLPS